MQITAALLGIMAILITNYCKIITNYNKNLLQITAFLLQIMTVGYYKLRQHYDKLRHKFITNYEKKSFQITAALIFKKFKIVTNYVKFYYILRQFLALLQIPANFNYKLLQVLQITSCNNPVFPHSSLFDDKRITLLSTLSKIHFKLIETNESSLRETLLFDNSLFDLKKNLSE